MSAIATPAACESTATAKPVIVNAIGRTTTGDNGGGRQPAAVKARVKAAASKTAPAKTVTATAMGPSGYRAEFGVLTDEQLVEAVRASLEPSGEFTLTDEQIVAAIGWALTVRTAVTKVKALVTA